MQTSAESKVFQEHTQTYLYSKNASKYILPECFLKKKDDEMLKASNRSLW